MRERNEALDCRVYARAAAWLLGIDRFDDAKFEALEEELRVAAEDEARPVDQRRPSPTAAPVRRSDWLGRRDKWF
jgi:phage terminase large subunit GpA-like protein